MIKYAVILLTLILPAVLPAAAQQLDVASPDGRIRFDVDVTPTDGRLHYTVTYGDRPALEGYLGVDAGFGAQRWDRNLTVIDSRTSAVDSVWTPVYGERSQIPDRYNERVIRVGFPGEDVTMSIDVRAYDEGVAFRYRWPEQSRLAIVTVQGEATSFTFPRGTLAWHTPGAQARYAPIALTGWRQEAEMPLTLTTPDGLFVSIAEANMVNFARSRLMSDAADAQTLHMRLFGTVVESSPFATPWRVLLMAARPGALLEHNYLLLNLNPPNRIADASWIRPGKVIREMTLSTAGARRLADFAAAHGLAYIHFDAGWYGHEYHAASDATTVTVDPLRNPQGDLDLQEAIAYAASKGVGVILYVNRRALERQMRTLFPLFETWGVAGVKFGFVQTGSHRWTTWLYDAVALAAEHRLMVNIHDEFRPTGHSRTWPNLMTQEGIHGNEEMPDATHNTVLPFTRFVAGAADYTPAYYFREEFGHAERHIQTTPAHQLALPVIYYSPLQWLYWYDVPSRDYRGEPEIAFWAQVPTVWDDTRVIDGGIGTHAVVARRSGDDWFVGAITSTEARSVSLPLDFLEPERAYTADIYSDGDDAIPTRTHVRIQYATVRAGQTLTFALPASGGVALRLSPADAGQPYPDWPDTLPHTYTR